MGASYNKGNGDVMGAGYNKGYNNNVMGESDNHDYNNVMGARNSKRSGNNNVMGASDNNRGRCCDHDRVEEIVSPTRQIVNTRTKTRTVRRIHPVEVINVNRTVVRNENFFPVTQRTVNETVEENFDCGSDLNNPNCRRNGGGGGLFSL
ncbi:CotD family spore coat protein [Bacillus yapensis]|nr:CotD family spore coat protein [Bacillus yapensis]